MEVRDKISYGNKIVHVIVGTIFIVVAYFRIFNYHVTKQTHVGVEAGIVY
jgi:cytochrome c oxidase subunit 3